MLLIPFHIFVIESRFENIESDEQSLKELKTYYSSIRVELEELANDEYISEFEKQIIIEMSNSVVDSLARIVHARQTGQWKDRYFVTGLANIRRELSRLILRSEYIYQLHFTVK